MVTRLRMGAGPSLFALLLAFMLLSVFAVRTIGKDVNSYTFPKGIVQQVGQYPSFVFGYTKLDNAIVWFDREGMLIDVHSPLQRHVFRVRVLNKGGLHPLYTDEVHAASLIQGKKPISAEHVYSTLALTDDHDVTQMIHQSVQQRWRWAFVNDRDHNHEVQIEGADSIVIDNARGYFRIYAQSMHVSLPIPVLETTHGDVKLSAMQKSSDIISFQKQEKQSEFSLNVPIVFSTFIGGSMLESINAVSLDNAGNIYVMGETESPDYPISVGAYSAPNAKPRDIFVAKFDSSGKQLLYSAKIGGSQIDKGMALAVDELGQACITGSTTSTDFPTTQNAFQSTKTLPDEDVFILKLHAKGNAILYGTFMIGMTTDIAHGIALDATGDIYIAGTTGILSKSPHTFPKTITAFDTSYNGGALDAFISKISPSNNGIADLKFSTVFGGNDIDIAYKIVIAKNGQIIIAGETSSDKNFPLTNGAIQTSYEGNNDGFISILNANADSLIYSTLLGGSGYERITGLTFDEPSRNIFFAGYTNSSGIPDVMNPNPVKFPITSGAFDTTYSGGLYDGFMGKFEPSSGAALKFSSFIGGSGDDFVSGIGVDVCAAPYVTGITSSNDFPITDDAPDSTHKRIEGFISKLNAFANVLVFSSYFGSTEDDQCNAIVVDGSGAIFIGGSSSGLQFPGNDAPMNGRDGFIAKIQVGILPLKPVIETKGSLSFCKGDSVILDVSSRNFISYQWRKNMVQIPGANTAILSVKESGLYTVDVADASGCTGSESVTVIAFDRPGLTIDPIPVLCFQDTVTIKVNSPDTLRSISWKPTTGLSCSDCLSPIAFPQTTTEYILTTIDTNGCSRTDTMNVYVIDSNVVTLLNVPDTLTICSKASGIIQFPIRNDSEVELTITITSFTSPLLSSTAPTIVIPPDSVSFIPIRFSGTSSTGPQVYGMNIADHCGSIKYAQCIVDVQPADFAYEIESGIETCRSANIERKISIKNTNALKGIIAFSSVDARVKLSSTSILMKPYGIDSLTISFLSDTVGSFPLEVLCTHECGSIDTIVWTVNVISKPYSLDWIADTSSKKSGMPFVQSFAIEKQSAKPIDSTTTFTITLLHEKSTLTIDSIISKDCNLMVSKQGDSVILTYSNCNDTTMMQTDVHVQSVIGETLNPWMKIASFRSIDPCIDPIVNKAADTVILEPYGCELTTVHTTVSTLQLLSVETQESMISIRFIVSEKRNARISCLSTVGQVTHTFPLGIVEPGEHIVKLPIKGFSAGVYALLIEADQDAASTLFMIME